MGNRTDYTRTSTGFEALTPREREVLEQYPNAGRGKELAQALGCSQQTVKNFSYSIRHKLECSTLGQAAIHYDRWRRSQQSWPEIERRSSQRRSGVDRRR